MSARGYQSRCKQPTRSQIENPIGGLLALVLRFRRFQVFFGPELNDSFDEAQRQFFIESKLDRTFRSLITREFLFVPGNAGCARIKADVISERSVINQPPFKREGRYVIT